MFSTQKPKIDVYLFKILVNSLNSTILVLFMVKFVNFEFSNIFQVPVNMSQVPVPGRVPAVENR